MIIEELNILDVGHNKKLFYALCIYNSDDDSTKFNFTICFYDGQTAQWFHANKN